MTVSQSRRNTAGTRGRLRTTTSRSLTARRVSGRSHQAPTAPTGSDIFERRESAVRSYCRGFDATLVSASGSLVRDAHGRAWIDFLAGAGSLNYGHNHPVLREALLNYLCADGIAHALDLHTQAKAEFLTSFESVILGPRGLDYRVQFTGPTGTNAVEAALKLARMVTGRSSIAAFTNAFHGVSLGALAATGNSTMRMPNQLPLASVGRLPFDGYFGDQVNTAEAISKLLDDPSSGIDLPAAIIVEVVQGEGGLNAASLDWLRQLAAIAKAHRCLLIVDDIQAGCGRTGSFFSFEAAGIVPDIVLLSKSISGFGLPMSLVLIRPDIDVWAPGQHNGTFRGNSHAFVTAKAALDYFWSGPDLADDIARRAAITHRELAAMSDRLPGSTLKGRGLMVGIDVLEPALASRIQRAAREHGVIIETCGPRDEVVKVMPPLTTPDDLLQDGLTRLSAAVDDALRS